MSVVNSQTFLVTGAGSQLTLNSTSALTINSGGQLSATAGGTFSTATGALNVGTATSGTLTVDGAGSTAVTGGAFALGGGSGAATLNVSNGGSFTVASGGSTTLGYNAVVNVNGGMVTLNSLTNNGGKINLNSGSLSFFADFSVDAGGLLGQNLTLDASKSLNVLGTTNVNPLGSLALSGGTLTTLNLIANRTNCYSHFAVTSCNHSRRLDLCAA